VLGADDVGAPHRRKRLWILAYRRGGRGPADELRAGRDQSRIRDTELADSDSRRREQRDARLGPVPEPDSGSPWHFDPADVGDAGSGLCVWRSHQSGRGPEGRTAAGRPSEADESGTGWESQPYVGRVAHGVASRVDRLRALGNGQVPQTMAAAFTYLAREAGLLR
jgi:DNA (cytosine-5)-methyltransferase 1